MRDDLSNRRFGRLLVLGPAATRHHNGRPQWHCRCDCGRVVDRLTSYLTSGDTRSCGCLHDDLARAKGRAKRIELLPGQQYGRLTVLAWNAARLGWTCRCGCGRLTTVAVTQLVQGRTKSCGCLHRENAVANGRLAATVARPKICRMCGRTYQAVGPRKYCSPVCWRRHHAQDEARRRAERHRSNLARQLEHAKNLLEDTHEQPPGHTVPTIGSGPFPAR